MPQRRRVSKMAFGRKDFHTTEEYNDGKEDLITEDSKYFYLQDGKEVQIQQTEFSTATFTELPHWLRDNQFIKSGYRVNFNFWLCVKSLFRNHNEQWNIWTHLLAFVGFFILTFVTHFGILHDPDPVDRFVFTVFLVCAQMQMLFSAVFHWFSCYSPVVYKWLAKLDYTGISVMIVGSYFPPIYYGFYCHMELAIWYLSIISLLGVVGVCVSLIPIFSSPRFRVVRTVFFLLFGFFAVFPVPHLIALNDKHSEEFWPVFVGLATMGALYTIGAIIYSTRIPERCHPGMFDNSLFCSHVIWHFFTIAAALTQLWNCIKSYELRMAYPCEA